MYSAVAGLLQSSACMSDKQRLSDEHDSILKTIEANSSWEHVACSAQSAAYSAQSAHQYTIHQNTVGGIHQHKHSSLAPPACRSLSPPPQRSWDAAPRQRPSTRGPAAAAPATDRSHGMWIEQTQVEQTECMHKCLCSRSHDLRTIVEAPGHVDLVRTGGSTSPWCSW